MVKPLTKVEIQLVRQFRVNEVSRQIFQPIENTTGTSFECPKTKSIACSLKSDSALSIEANTTSIIMRGENSCDQQTYKLVSYLVLRVCRLSTPGARDPKTGVVFSWVPEFH